MSLGWLKFVSDDKDKKLRSDNKSEQQLSADIVLSAWALGAFFLVGLYTAWWCSGWKGLAILWALACVATGTLAGFLFGIPRVLQNNAPPQNPGSTAPDKAVTSSEAKSVESSYQVNTNLEQVSDWLTKIIVGLGLVELRRIDDYLVRATTFIGPGISDSNSQALAGGIIIYFSVLGFLGGYIMTRLFLAGAFARADRGINQKEEKIVNDAMLSVEDSDATLDPTELEAAEKIARAPLRALKVSEIPIWAKAKLMVGQFEEAADAYNFLLGTEPRNALYHIRLAQVHASRRNWEEALKKAKIARDCLSRRAPDQLVQQVYKALTYYPLYIEPDGYKQTIEFTDQYRQLLGKKPTGAMWVNVASARGQQASKEPQYYQLARTKALEAIREAIKDDLEWKIRLKTLLIPSEDSEDDDLKVFQGEQEFVDLIVGPEESTSAIGSAG
jgi:tetratricopeptide (TPR) repeat protein